MSIPTHKPPSFAPDSSRKTDFAYRERHKFYNSRRWKSLRKQYIQRNPLCADCEAIGVYTPAENVHHVVERLEAPELAYEWSNLQSLCIPCHNRKRV